MENQKCCLGEMNTNSKGTRMQIVNIRKQSDIDIQFLDKYGYIKEHVKYPAFIKGEVKTRMIQVYIMWDILALGNTYLL